MSVKTVRASLYTLLSEAKTAGELTVGVVFRHIPRTLLQSELPAVLIYPAAASYENAEFSESAQMETRRYRIICYIQDITLGAENQASIDADDLFEQFRAFLSNYRGLPDSTNARVVYDTRLVSDAGLVVLDYASRGDNLPRNYVALDFTLEVVDYHKVCQVTG